MSRTTDSSNTGHTFAPFAVVLLPFALAMHIAEEWFLGFPDWARLALEIDIEAARFLYTNLIGLALCSIGAAISFREPGAAWIGVSLAALFSVNTILHAGLSVVVGVYSPGTITGLFLYIPLSFLIFRWSATHLSRAAFAGALLIGIGIHFAATLAVLI
ncbi:MAG: HXXEE domain-containing protein [Acidobacteriota bacterium]|nr:HXXEE domain-containing protein [Acidobacteriota bacterium]